MFKTKSARRRGTVLVYAAAGLVTFLGAAALAIDMGSQYTRKSEAQNAADAAALAGAAQLDTILSPQAVANAYAAAVAYAKANNYDPDRGATVVGVPNPTDENGVAHPDWYRVTLSRPETLFFARIFGQSSGRVQATATAVHKPGSSNPSSIPVGGGGTYGIAGGPVNLSMFGPYGFYSYGDPYSTIYLNDGQTLNKDYKSGGVNFDINLANLTGNEVEVEIFDPDCHNAGGEANAAGGLRVDEIRSGQAGATNNFTTTQYTLYSDNGTPDNPADDTSLDSKTFGDDVATDMKWNSVFRFTRDPNQKYYVNAKTIDGASENGFDLRAGPPHDPTLTDQEWSQQFGTQAPMTARGRMPMNFNTDGQVKFALGFVPGEAEKVFVKKFDTDIGGRNIVYESSDGRTFTGVTAGNGEWVTDAIDLPADYAGGFWYATYYASSQDTSSWEMTYSGPDILSNPETPRTLNLVR